MRFGNVFWGMIIIVSGAVLLLANLGILQVNVWAVIWPLVLVLLGIWFLLGPRMAGRNREVVNLALPLDGARLAELRMDHGAGRLEINDSAAADLLLSGRFEGGVERTFNQSGGSAQVRLSLPSAVFVPSFGPGFNQGFLWQVGLNPLIEYHLGLNTGAGEARLDLTRLKVTAVRLDTGASNTEISLPEAAGYTKVDIHGGANSVKLTVPASVAARIEVQAVMSGVNVDTIRFPKINGSTYQSSDFASAANRVEIKFEGAIGSISVR